jgi:hypothetical protein
MEQLPLAGRRSGADVVEVGATDAPGEDQIGGGLDDPAARGRACRGELGRRGHTFSIELSGPTGLVL